MIKKLTYILCENCARRMTDKYLNMLKCKLNSINISFKAEADQKKMSKRNQISEKLNIARNLSY